LPCSDWTGNCSSSSSSSSSSSNNTQLL
jgi:hypothetical protein